MSKIENLAVNAIRVLSVDAVQKANSGHPGMPLGAAPIAYTIWAKHLRNNPKKADWINRDRYVLSAGHASAMYYSLLHLFGYEVSLDDLKAFRQFESKTPGHPEYGHTHGVDVTTGPLGTGLATAVGMAMAQEHMAAKFNRPGHEILDNYTYVMAGDGCMMEGITSEASSIAGTLKLGRLIVIYDSNNITIEGSTDLAFTENVRARYEAYGFETFLVEDGNDLEAINAAIEKAKANLDKPSFIEVKTKIGYKSPKEGTAGVHGSPLGDEGVKSFKEAIEYPSQEPFFVPEEVYEYYRNIVSEKEKESLVWDEDFAAYREAYPQLAKQWDEDFAPVSLEALLENKDLWSFDTKANSTRNLSGEVLNRLVKIYPNFFGGSADLAGSTVTTLKGESSFSADNYAGKNLHYGVREMAMAALGNGFSLFGGLHAYVATFFVFADFLKPVARLSSLMHLPLTYVLTHDSIGVGEDGPTHEPVEQLTMLRSQPNFITFRPADATETMAGWAVALSSQDAPVGLVLTRQNLPYLEETSQEAVKGAYILKDVDTVDAILIATGSEVSLALDAAKKLDEKGVKTRVVSMPSPELFEKQSAEYKESVLPNAVRARVAVEAGASMSWGQYIGLDGAYVCLDHFGASAPANKLFEAFGFTTENVVNTVLSVVKK